jgi:dTDP-4-dehydrorhamnose reductase
VFDGHGTRPWIESDPTNPLGVYARTKRDGEVAVASVGGSYLTFRTSWVYGVYGANFVKTMLRLGRERKSLSVVSDQIGAPTSARALADATAGVLAALAHANHDPSYGLYHMVCTGEVSWHGFAEEIFRLARAQRIPLQVEDVKAIRSEDYPLRAVRPKNSRLDCQLLAARFCVRMPTWQEALAQVMPELLRG